MNFVRLGVTLFIGGFILLITYGMLIEPYTDMTNQLRDSANTTIDVGSREWQYNENLLSFLPNVLGIIAIIMFIGAGLAFIANSIYKDPEEYDY